MDLKFSFGASNPLPLATDGAGSASLPISTAPASTSSALELRVSLTGATPALAVCEAISGDGVSYARAEKSVQDPVSSTDIAAAVRSALARAGAELPEQLLGSVTGVRLDLDGREIEVLAKLGIPVASGVDSLAAVDEALQARTGLAAGTPIRGGGADRSPEPPATV